VTPNDGQIDLLIRRFAAGVPAPNDGDGHLDADELNAFAEGALPDAARGRYISHLAECDHCRKQVADLAIASGAMVRVAEPAPDKVEKASLWATLTGMFSLPVLRYGALAAVVLIVAGVAFVALRPRPGSRNLIASSETHEPQPVSAVKPPPEAGNGLDRQEKTVNPASPLVSQTPAPAGAASAGDRVSKPEPEAAKLPAAPTTLESPKEIAGADIEPMKKGEAPVAVQSLPYAPPPAGVSQSGGRMGQGQSQTGAGTFGGFKVQQQADKAQAEDRERDAKDARLDDLNRQQSNQPTLAQRGASDEKQKGGPSRNIDNSNMVMNSRNSTEMRKEAPRKSDGAAANEEAPPPPKSVGGRKFVRQGNRWVDQKFKSSMSLTNISRGSDEFAALDSGVRSIAQQLSGEIIVVSKGKAYLIK
jgi:hypothetical protein